MPAACSKRYMDLVRTVGGLTPDRPWEPLSLFGFTEVPADPSPNEYAEWRELTIRLAAETRFHLHVLGAIEEIRFQEDNSRGYPKWNEFFESSNEIATRAGDLPGSIGILFQGDFSSVTSLRNGIAAAVDISIAAVCLMEKVDNAIAAYGGKAPEIAKRSGEMPHEKGVSIVGLITVIVVSAAAVGGVIYLARRPSKASTPVLAEGSA